MKSDQVRNMKNFEVQNSRLQRAMSDLTLDKIILKEAASGNF
jgi:putative transposase